MIQKSFWKNKQQLETVISHWWYEPLIAFLALIDYFLIILPMDGIMIASCMLRPKKWWRLTLAFTIGSTLGGLLIAAITQHYGLPFIETYFQTVLQSSLWKTTEDFFTHYGLVVVFLFAASPFNQHPALMIAALAKTPLLDIAGVLVLGRLIKTAIIAYAGAFAPQYLGKMFGLQSDLKSVGIETTKKN